MPRKTTVATMAARLLNALGNEVYRCEVEMHNQPKTIPYMDERMTLRHFDRAECEGEVVWSERHYF